MHNALDNIVKFYDKIEQFCRQRVDEFGAQYVVFGIFGIINYPVSYFIWQSAIPQIYNPLSLRILATALCVPLALKNYWPQKFRTFLPVYWYLTLLYCIPFFATLMLLKNHASTGWLMNVVLGLFLFILLIDWISFIVLSTLGVVLGWLCYWISVKSAPLHLIDKNTLPLALYMYTFAIIIGAIFSRNKEKATRAKFQTIKATSIAHELRTPLRAIDAAASTIKVSYPKLLQGYQLAEKENLPVPYINPFNYEALLTAPEAIESETRKAFTIINMQLMNASESMDSRNFVTCSICQCVNEALRRYPFDKDEEPLVHWKNECDFLFNGSEILIVHVLFNLLKNAFYQIKAARKGSIEIWAVQKRKYNTLHFKDTAKGISPKILHHIFDQFFTLSTNYGTGVGLAFCRIVMENLEGKITCHSVEGEYAEFVLHFPCGPAPIKDAEAP